MAMNENPEHETLLPNPLNEELLPSGETAPLLSAKEFIKTTSERELNDIFGILPEKFFAPSTPSTTAKQIAEPNPSLTSAEKPQLLKKFARALAIIILIIFIFFVALYIWGYFLKK